MTPRPAGPHAVSRFAPEGLTGRERAIVAEIREERARQGLGPTLTDPAAIATIAAVIRGSAGKAKAARAIVTPRAAAPEVRDAIATPAS